MTLSWGWLTSVLQRTWGERREHPLACLTIRNRTMSLLKRFVWSLVWYCAKQIQNLLHSPIVRFIRGQNGKAQHDSYFWKIYTDRYLYIQTDFSPCSTGIISLTSHEWVTHEWVRAGTGRRKKPQLIKEYQECPIAFSHSNICSAKEYYHSSMDFTQVSTLWPLLPMWAWTFLQENSVFSIQSPESSLLLPLPWVLYVQLKQGKV